ncbi:molybdopterin-binding protein [Pseudomarimonas arenosa]|uniref:Bifunctional molybdenum cofactor biosynthesis protein MoaC/MoaB n=1 Tax=Pseudomarimonas arenosa TaxID=2774145 RepID=A0AAW3ZTG7_9GAMM|nr:molybdopterin-binding protein [Pseudomarimonas arenosa]MBD8527451.1 bifunctional molybdenum cofactor biosynthesis protein MoaC/MoaB [Pseudomarimonas arenosa]
MSSDWLTVPVLGNASPALRQRARGVARGELVLQAESDPASLAAELHTALFGLCQVACRDAVLRPNCALNTVAPGQIQHLRLLLPMIQDRRVRVYCEVKADQLEGLAVSAMAGLGAALLVLHQWFHQQGRSARIDSQQILLEEANRGALLYSTLDDHERRLLKPKAALQLPACRAAVLVLSDRAADGRYADRSGPILLDGLQQLGADIAEYRVLPDETDLIQQHMVALEAQGVRLCLLSGGTGLGPRDCTPDALSALGLREVPGFGELFRHATSEITPLAWLSRASAYQFNRMLILALPGNPRAVAEGWEVWQPLLDHALAMVEGGSHP